MSLYDEYTKEKGSTGGSLYDQFQTESKAKTSVSLYDQFKSDMADKPPVVEAPKTSAWGDFAKGVLNFVLPNPIKSSIDTFKTVDKVKRSVTDRLSETGLFKGAAEAYNMADEGRLDLGTRERLAPALLEGASNPVGVLANTKRGQKMTSTIEEGSSDLPLKIYARLKSLGDKTYEEARDALLEKRNDPNNSRFEKIIYGVQDSGVQSAIGALLSVAVSFATKNPSAGMAVSAPYFAAISAEGQRKEKGKVTSTANVAIDTIGDILISGLAENVLRNVAKESGKSFFKQLLVDSAKGALVEGTTEPTQSFLKYANDYINAPTEAERAGIVSQLTDYVKNGGMVDEFLISAISGGLITGGANIAGQMTGKNVEVDPNIIIEDKQGAPNEEEPDKETVNKERETLIKQSQTLNDELVKVIDNTTIPTKKREGIVRDLSEEIAKISEKLNEINGRVARTEAAVASENLARENESIANITKQKTPEEIIQYVNQLDTEIDSEYVPQDQRGILDFTKKQIQANDNYSLRELNIQDLIKNDPDLKEYVDANEQRYDGERDFFNLDNPIVVGSNGEIIDGMNRILTLLSNGETMIRGYVGSANEDLASPVPIRGASGRFEGSVSDKAKRVSVASLMDLSSNSLNKNQAGMREKTLQYYKENPQEITRQPVRVREVDGKLVIEDGRHRVMAANQLGIDNLSVQDVTPLYPETEGTVGKPSEILSKIERKPAIKKQQEDLASTPRGEKTIRKILEERGETKSTDVTEVPADFKISERAKQILEEFGVPIVEGGISNRFLGLYKGATKAVRVQALYDITTVTHEAIHGIDDRINFSRDLIADTKRGAPIRKQLTEIYEKLYPGGDKRHSLSKRIKEGLAVLFENYFYNPAEIKAAYPELVNAFIKPDGEYYDPLFTQLIEKMNSLVDDYARMTPEQRIASRIRTGKEVVDKDTGFTKEQRAVFETVNRFEPLKRYAKKAGVSETWDDPMVQAFNILNKNSIVYEWIKGGSTPILLRDGNFKVEKGSVKDYLDLIKGDEKAFYTYLVARRVHEANNNVKALENEIASYPEGPVRDAVRSELQEKIDKIKSVLEADDFSTQDAAAVVSKYASKFAEAEQIYDDINRRLIDFMYENDLINKEDADTYKAEKGYASFKRFIDDKLSSVGTLKSSSASKVTSLKERKGSQLDLQSPVQSQILAINEIVGKGMENRLWNKVADLAKNDTEIARRFERVEAITSIDANGNVSFPQEKDPNTIRVFRNGKREFYKAAPEFIAVSKTLRGKEYDFFVQLMRVPASTFTRLTTSANPLFAAGNLLVDQVTATVQSKTGFKPIIDPIKSFIAFLQKDEAIQVYKAIGGKRQTLAAYFDLSPDEVTHKLTGGQTKMERVSNIVDVALSALEWPSNTSEIMTRFSEFQRSVEKGEPMSVAMYRASEVTTPFQLQGNMGGRFGQEYIKSIPYLNATIQVLYKFGRTVKSDPKRVGMMLAALLAASFTSAIALMKGASDDQKRLLGEQPARNFSRYLYAPSPNGKDLIKIRIPEQFGAFTGMVYLYVIGQYGGNEASFGDYLDNVMSAVPEQVNILGWQNAKKAALSYVPQVLKPTVMTATNSKVFPDVGPIVPPYVVDKAPKEQYNIYTSEVAKTIGGLLGASPILTDFWIKNQFGVVGGFLTGKSPSNPIQVNEEDFVMSGRSYSRFYDNKTLVAQQYEEIRKNNPDKYTDTDKEQIKIEKGSYDKMGDALSDMRKISQTKELPDEVKKLAYDILLDIDVTEDQEDVRMRIGELKGLIADLKE